LLGCARTRRLQITSHTRTYLSMAADRIAGGVHLPGSHDVSAIVIDNGSYEMRGGFAGDDVARTTFPTQISHRLLDASPQQQQQWDKENKKEYYIGEEIAALKKTNPSLTIRSPVEHGTVRYCTCHCIAWHVG
jgi:hypothetical protein